MKAINPATNELIKEYREHTDSEVEDIIEKVHEEWLSWKETTFEYRAGLFRNLAGLLRKDKEKYARLMTLEMGKIIRESLAEIEKCANGCDYYADHAKELLKDQAIPSDASRSIVVFEPLGIILAVMPWNFPFWQVFRFAAPSLMAGNAAVLKHASNVPGCALAIEELFCESGFPENVFRTLMIPSDRVEPVITNRHIMAVTLTGSEVAGSNVALTAGRLVKKTVLELGGSDPFIVLEDADMDKTVSGAMAGRMVNMGQSCIAAKRFIVLDSKMEEFENKIRAVMAGLRMGDPLLPETEVGPLARKDLVDDIDRQVQKSVEMGAKLILGGKRADPPGFYYLPTVLSGVSKGMPVYQQETFGPVLAIIRVKSMDEAIEVANDSEFGLGGSVWTKDLVLGEAVARKVHTGAMFVNENTKSDPRLPFGGIKKSGYGRELSEYGIKEFVNIKTIWVK
jgi:succinate-semialdehyde dehydrogenase / glutarate-semialdehyde dehydrogenase